MSKKEKKELTIDVTDEIAARMAADPEMAAAIRELFAAFRQAHHAVQTGQYKSMEDAMEAITGSRPVAVGPDDVPDEAREAIEGFENSRKMLIRKS